MQCTYACAVRRLTCSTHGAVSSTRRLGAIGGISGTAVGRAAEPRNLHHPLTSAANIAGSAPQESSWPRRHAGALDSPAVRSPLCAETTPVRPVSPQGRRGTPRHSPGNTKGGRFRRCTHTGHARHSCGRRFGTNGAQPDTRLNNAVRSERIPSTTGVAPQNSFSSAGGTASSKNIRNAVPLKPCALRRTVLHTEFQVPTPRARHDYWTSISLTMP